MTNDQMFLCHLCFYCNIQYLSMFVFFYVADMYGKCNNLYLYNGCMLKG